MRKSIGHASPSLFRAIAAAVVLCAAAPSAGAPSPRAQDRVTGGEELIGHVRLLKTLGKKVHLEWLYLEDRLDRLPEQRALVRSGRALEFTDGLLYHGRDGLDDALLDGSVRGGGYFTRAPHVWAVGPFLGSSRSPAIFVVEALDFNRWRDSGAAILEAERDASAGIMDPYPKVVSDFSLSSVAAIWTDEDTGERYIRLLKIPDEALSIPDRRLKAAVRPWIESGRLVVLRGLHHERLDPTNFYPAAYEIVGRFFTEHGLVDRMPRFRPRGNGSGASPLRAGEAPAAAARAICLFRDR